MDELLRRRNIAFDIPLLVFAIRFRRLVDNESAAHNGDESHFAPRQFLAGEGRNIVRTRFQEFGEIIRRTDLRDNDFAVMSYTEAIEKLENSGKEFQYPVFWGCDLATEHERYISEEICKKPVFLTDYPKEIKSFYMKQNADGKTVAATDLLVPGVGEIIGGSEREADLDKLLTAMNERNMNLDDYNDYIALRKFGSVPHSGFGLGLERIIMYVTGVSNIRDVILYPRTFGNIY